MSVTMGIPVTTRRMNTPSLHLIIHFGWVSGEWTTHVEDTPKMSRSYARIGYARVSTADWTGHSIRLTSLVIAGCRLSSCV